MVPISQKLTETIFGLLSLSFRNLESFKSNLDDYFDCSKAGFFCRSAMTFFTDPGTILMEVNLIKCSTIPKSQVFELSILLVLFHQE